MTGIKTLTSDKGPCVVYNCENYETCKHEKKACQAFVRFVAYGSIYIKSEFKKGEFEKQTEPTYKSYNKVFNDGVKQ